MAAEFFGNCQICGREHKTSEVSIATHGYTIRNGWQEGACYGSGGKPIQLSCDLIQGALDSANRYIERTNDEIAKLKVNPLDDNGMICMFSSRTTRTGSVITLHRVTIVFNDDELPVALDERSKKVIKAWPFYTGIKTLAAAAEELADTRIGYLKTTILQTEENIIYMLGILKNWKPSNLRPVTSDDHAKTAPKKHFSAKKWSYTTTACSRSLMAAQSNASKWITTNRDEVTCAACLKDIAAMDARSTATAK